MTLTAIDVTLIERGWFMNNKLIYWIPIIGAFVSLIQFEKENGMNAFWSYYQAIMIMAFITIVAIRTF
jgi:hypothetical protein